MRGTLETFRGGYWHTGWVPGTNRSCVLFDLDGVLVDSRDAITGCINHALTEHGLCAQPVEVLHRFIGPPLASAFVELTGHPSDSKLVASCIDSYRSHYAEASLRETVVVPRIGDVLSELAGEYQLGVATSKSPAFAEPLLGALGLRPFFTAVAGPDLSAHGEDKATTIAAALRMLDYPQRAVMIGDRSHDIAGANAHSLLSIGVTWGIGSRKELRAAGADAMATTPAELPPTVKLLLE